MVSGALRERERDRLLPPHLVSRVSVGAVAVTAPEVEVRVVMAPVEDPKLVVVEVLKLVEVDCIMLVSISNF